MNQGAGQPQLLLHAPGKLTSPPFAEGRQPCEAQQPFDALFALRPGHAEHISEEVQVFINGQVTVQAENLRHIADAVLDLFGISAGIVAVNGSRTGVGVEDGSQQAQRGRFTRTVRPHQSEHLTTFDREGEIINRNRTTKGTVQVVCLDDRFGVSVLSHGSGQRQSDSSMVAGSGGVFQCLPRCSVQWVLRYNRGMRKHLPIILIALFGLLLASCVADITPPPYQTDAPPSPSANPAPAQSGSQTDSAAETSPTMTPEPASTEVACTETAGRVETGVLTSLSAGEVRYRVYLPPCYDFHDARYPLLIMLHGMGVGMDDTQWDSIGLDEAMDAGIVAGTLPPMIVLMPNGNDMQYDYDPGPLPAVIVNEFLPLMAGSYCATTDPAYRAIGGLSRGGYWAYATAFLNPGQFGQVGGHSGFFYEGDYPQANPNSLAVSAPGIEGLAMYLDYAADDTLTNTRVPEFNDRLRTRGLAPTFVINPSGGHTEAYWSEHVAEYLAWYGAKWSLDTTTYPACTGG